MIYIFIFVMVTLNLGNLEPLVNLQKPIVVIDDFDWRNIINPLEWYGSYPDNIIDNKESICKSLNDAAVFDVSKEGLYNSQLITNGLQIETQFSTLHRVQIEILERYKTNFDLLPCKYRHKQNNIIGWIYLAGAKNFDGFILLITYPFILNSTEQYHLQFVGFLTEMYHFKMMEESKYKFQKAFKNYSSSPNELLFDAAYQSGRFDWKIKNYIQCASVHQMISEGIRNSYESFTSLTVKYRVVDLSSFMDEEASTSSTFQIFRKPKNRKISTLECSLSQCEYNIFPHPKEYFHSFVIYKCRDVPEFIAYFKVKK